MKQKNIILFLFVSFLLFLAIVQAEAKELTVTFDQGHGHKFVIEKDW